MNTDMFLPLRYSQDTVSEVSSITVNNPLQQNVPFLTYPRVMHESKTSRRYHAVRYGSAMWFENTRLGTREGNEDLQRRQAQMSNQMRRQAAHVAQALMICPDTEETAWKAMFGVTDYTSLCGAIQREVDETALVNKTPNGMAQLINTYSKVIKQASNVEPNGLMIDPDVQAFLEFERQNTAIYPLGEPPVPLVQEGRAFNGVTVVSPVIYKPEHSEPAASSPTTSLRRFGTHTISRASPYYHLGKRYLSAHRTIGQYNGDTDSWAYLSILDSLKYWGRWNKYGFLRHDHVVMAAQGLADNLFIYQVDGVTRNNDKYMRVARCFGLMENKWLSSTAQHAVATSACSELTDDQMNAIRRGVALYERILGLKHLGAAITDTVLNGKASYTGLYFISKMTAPGTAAAGTAQTPVTRADVEDASAFIDAWGEFYHMMAAKFGSTYNPCLDHRKRPKWLPAIGSAGYIPDLYAGALVLFESTIAHDTGVLVTNSDPARPKLLKRATAAGAPPSTVDFKDHEEVAFDTGTAVSVFGERFRFQEEGAAMPLEVTRNMQAIATYHDWLSAYPRLQEMYDFFLFASVHGDVQWAGGYTEANVGTDMPDNYARVSAAAKAVPASFAPRKPADAENTRRFNKFEELIGWLQSFVGRAMRPEFNNEADQEYLLRKYIGELKPVNTTRAAAETRFSPLKELKGTAVMLTPSDVDATQRYLTPGSNFTTSAVWNDREKEDVRTASFFRGVSDAYAHFYVQHGDVISFLIDDPVTDQAALQRVRFDPIDEAIQTEPKDHHHFTHPSFPFEQKHWRTKFQQALRQEAQPWERAARIVFLATPVCYQVGWTERPTDPIGARGHDPRQRAGPRRRALLQAVEGLGHAQRVALRRRRGPGRHQVRPHEHHGRRFGPHEVDLLQHDVVSSRRGPRAGAHRAHLVRGARRLPGRRRRRLLHAGRPRAPQEAELDHQEHPDALDHRCADARRARPAHADVDRPARRHLARLPPGGRAPLPHVAL
jgi:hypothetical protein